MVNACPMCLEDEETVDHLLLRCIYAVKIWNSVIGWFGCKWVLPKLLQHLFEAWKSPTGSLRGKELCKLLFLLAIWHIWKERNARCFEETNSFEEILSDKIKFSVAQWVKINTLFKDYPMHQIMYNWNDIAFS